MKVAGSRVVVTQSRPGRLAALLAERGAHVDHVALIAIAEPADRTALDAALAGLDSFDWLVVTSVHGAERVGAAAASANVKLAAVGSATAATLEDRAGRPVDLVPRAQRAEGLLADFPTEPASILLAQGNLARRVLADGLRARGHHLTTVEVYTTTPRPPEGGDIALLERADAVVLASGSAVDALVAGTAGAIGATVVAIGPVTAAAAAGRGLHVTSVADSPGDDDVVAAVVAALARHAE